MYAPRVHPVGAGEPPEHMTRMKRNYRVLAWAVLAMLIADVVLFAVGFSLYDSLASTAAFAVAFVFSCTTIVVDLPAAFAPALPDPGRARPNSPMATRYVAWAVIAALTASVIVQVFAFVYAGTPTALVLFIIAFIAVLLAFVPHIGSMRLAEAPVLAS